MGGMSKLASSGNENGGSKSVLDNYSNKVFRLVVLIVPIFFLCGNGTMTVLHYMGMYPAIKDTAMWCSNAIDILYLVIAVILIKTSYGPDGFLIPKRLVVAKWILMFMVVIQWNLNSYICPFEDFWGYAPLFVIVQAFFFDTKLVQLSTFLILASMVLSWFINGENLLPVKNEFYVLNIVFRVVGLAFTLFSINIVTWFGKAFIIETLMSLKKAQEMQDISSEYEKEARMKSDFLANMSHEIRTPMNAVIGMAEIAMRENLTPAARDCLIQIQKSGRNLLNIINDILDYSKIESGKMEILPEKYEPVVELNDISNVLATRVGDKELDFYVVIDPEMPKALLGDSMRIRQILINLANNAIKFTQKGSVGIIVDCEFAEEDVVNLTYHIRDTGIGIKKEDMEKLFVSFQQVDSRRNRSVEGTGLGLAISQRLVESMDGKIGVNSEYGKGSDFWFTIPQKIMDSSKLLTVKHPDKKRVLVLDEEPERVMVFLKELARVGVGNGSIAQVSDYKPTNGRRDYLFFGYSRYTDSVREFLDQHREVTGIVLIGFDSTFKSEQKNLYTLRSPSSTHKLVRLLNDEKDETHLYESGETFEAGFVAPKANLLIVDDNEVNITIAKGLLAPMAMNIDSVLSGPEAIEKVKKEKYDIVLMDHMMPGMDGVDTTKIIRETVAKEDELVIIALSANALQEAQNKFLEVGMNDFVAKPIEIKELVSKIKKWLPPEKIERGTTRQKVAEEDLSDPLMDFKLLDTKHALKSLGSVKLFREIAGEYYRVGREKSEGIKQAYTDGDIKDFTIRVHALKSSSRQIGAIKIGDLAESLENAGNRGDETFIQKKTDELLSLYNALLDGLKEYFPETETNTDDLPVLPDEVKTELIAKLRDACDELDMDQMEEVRDEFKKYAWPEEQKDDLQSLCKAIDDLDSDACEEIMGRLLE